MQPFPAAHAVHPQNESWRSSLHSPACISHLLFYYNIANGSNRDHLYSVLMQNHPEGAFRTDISEITKFYISLKNSINYEHVLLFSNLQCLYKCLIPFQDAQQCVLNWTLMYTHYLPLQILGMAHPLESLEPEPSVRVGLSLQYINQKWNKSGHVGKNLVMQNENTKVSQFW